LRVLATPTMKDPLIVCNIDFEIELTLTVPTNRAFDLELMFITVNISEYILNYLMNF
jgi:hypothetical protein